MQTIDAADIETIQLSHRSAESVVEIVRPLLEPSETIIPNGSMLVVKAGASKISEIRKLVQQLDKAQHRLVITVAQGRGLTLDGLNVGKGGHVYQTQNDAQTQRIQTLDGQAALIRFGEEFPVSSQAIIGYGASAQGSPQNPGGQVILSQTGQYKAISTGFEVTPRVSGQRVTLDVTPWSEQFNRSTIGYIDSHDAHTTMIAPLGEWVELGGQVSTRELSDTGQYAHNYSTRSSAEKIFIKVEDLDADRR